jgi:quercetin dioxygenase-like cupin family protein
LTSKLAAVRLRGMRGGAFVLWGIAVLTMTCGIARADPPPLGAQVSTINGAVPGGVLAPLQEVSTMIDTTDADGQRLVVFQGVRKPGTRAPIHVHAYGGLTCVLSGTMTDFVEGHESMTFPAGTCYYMPPNTPMAAANLGTEDVRITDTFNLPPDASIITVIEPGWSDPHPDDAG